MIGTAPEPIGIVGLGRIGGSVRKLLLDHAIGVIGVDVGDDPAPLSACRLIVECVPEARPVKANVLAEVRRRAPSAVLLSTTSSFTASGLMPGDRRGGLWHPFAPMARRRLIEIAAPTYADPDVAGLAAHLAELIGARWVRAADSPGLIGNRVLKRWTHAGLASVDAGVPADVVDRAFIDAGFVMGPVSVVSLVGPETSLAVSHSFTLTLGERFTPPAVLAGFDPAGDWPPAPEEAAAAPDDLVDRALDQVRDEISRILADGAVAHPVDVREVLEMGLGWPRTIVDTLHSW